MGVWAHCNSSPEPYDGLVKPGKSAFSSGKAKYGLLGYSGLL
jgi:hypothetical protein